MKAKIFFLCALLTSGAGSAAAQTLNLLYSEKAGASSVTVDLRESTDMTALQFRLAMPAGVTYADKGSTNCGATLATTNSKTHTLSVQELSNGDLLVIVYSMDLKALKNGALLSIPIVMPATPPATKGQLTSVRFSDNQAISYTGTDGLVTAISDVPAAPEAATADGQRRDAFTIYDLSGRRLPAGQTPRGIYIQGGKKRVGK